MMTITLFEGGAQQGELSAYAIFIAIPVIVGYPLAHALVGLWALQGWLDDEPPDETYPQYREARNRSGAMIYVRNQTERLSTRLSGISSSSVVEESINGERKRFANSWNPRQAAKTRQ